MSSEPPIKPLKELSPQELKEKREQQRKEREKAIAERKKAIAEVETRLSRTGTKGNNCGLNCVVHFLAAELMDPNMKAQDLAALYRKEGYADFLKSFESYYPKLKPVTPELLKNICKAYPHPKDRETIFCPPARKTLGSAMKKEFIERTKKSVAADIPEYNAFTSDVLQYVATGSTNSKHYANFYALQANSKWVHENFGKNGPLERPKINETQEIFEKRRQDAISNYFFNQGFNKYVDFISDPKNAALISSEELGRFTDSLGINLTVYKAPDLVWKPSDIDNFPQNRKLEIHNNGIHWDLVAANKESADAHNAAIENQLSEIQTINNRGRDETPENVRVKVEKAIQKNKDIPKSTAIPKNAVVMAPIKRLSSKPHKQPNPNILTQFNSVQTAQQQNTPTQTPPEPTKPQPASIKKLRK